MSDKESLELKHILPYLRYNLKCKYPYGNKEGFIRNVVNLSLGSEDVKVGIGFMDEQHVWMFKPLLRPMSDQFNPIGSGIGGAFSVANLICDKKSDLELTEDENGFYIWYHGADELLDFTEPQDLPHWITEILNEHHFDWRYDLILKRLAEPIRKLAAY